MNTNLGYDKHLYILPFDHRASFAKTLFGIKDREPNDEEKNKIIDAKQIIYEAFQLSHSKGVPPSQSAILIDEQYGDAILHDAVNKQYTVILTVEKSGQDVFDFEYGEEFRNHIEKYKPTFVKALVRHNPEMDEEKRYQQLSRLRILSDFAHQNEYKFLIEPLIPATKLQLEKVENDQRRFDREIRPQLTTVMMQQLQEAGIEPDVWKIEGMENADDYKMAVQKARSNSRDNVGIVILGRGANQAQVEHWLIAGKEVDGVIGFAVGRTVFWDPLVSYKDGKIDRTETVELIAKNYMHFYNLFAK